jgi:hypothetical protein
MLVVGVATVVATFAPAPARPRQSLQSDIRAPCRYDPDNRTIRAKRNPRCDAGIPHNRYALLIGISVNILTSRTTSKTTASLTKLTTGTNATGRTMCTIGKIAAFGTEPTADTAVTTYTTLTTDAKMTALTMRTVDTILTADTIRAADTVYTIDIPVFVGHNRYNPYARREPDNRQSPISSHNANNR